MTSLVAASQTKWEYCSLTRVSESAMVESLNQLGQESWELVSASHYRDMQGMMAWTAILKRPTGDTSARSACKEGSAAPMATPPAPKPAAATTPAAAEDDTEFDVVVPAARPPRPASSPKATKLGPAKQPVVLSDDFDFELAETKPVAQQATQQTKAKKPAAADEDFDFELGDTFPEKVKPSAPAAPKPKADQDSDDTDFDLG